MVVLLFLAAIAHSSSAGAALELCKPVLAQEANGDIDGIDIDSNHLSRGVRTIRGELIALLRMGAGRPGEARANHVIRAVYSYECRVEHGRVRSASLSSRR